MDDISFDQFVLERYKDLVAARQNEDKAGYVAIAAQIQAVAGRVVIAWNEAARRSMRNGQANA